MSDIYERMKKLLVDVGVSFNDGGFSTGEIKAYAAGLKLVRDKIEDAFNKVYIIENDNCDLTYFADLVNVDLTDSDKTKDNVIWALSFNFGKCDKNTFQRGFSQIGEGNYQIDDNTVVFDDITISKLKFLGNFISTFVPLCVNVRFNGTGITFDKWEELNFNFNKTDEWNLPFDIIDSLRSDMIE